MTTAIRTLAALLVAVSLLCFAPAAGAVGVSAATGEAGASDGGAPDPGDELSGGQSGDLDGGADEDNESNGNSGDNSDGTLDDPGGTLNDTDGSTGNESNGTLNDPGGTLNDTDGSNGSESSGTSEDPDESMNNTVDDGDTNETTEEPSDTVDSGSIDETTDATTEGPNDTAEDVGDALNKKTGDLEETLNRTVNNTEMIINGTVEDIERVLGGPPGDTEVGLGDTVEDVEEVLDRTAEYPEREPDETTGTPGKTGDGPTGVTPGADEPAEDTTISSGDGNPPDSGDGPGEESNTGPGAETSAGEARQQSSDGTTADPSERGTAETDSLARRSGVGTTAPDGAAGPGTTLSAFVVGVALLGRSAGATLWVSAVGGSGRSLLAALGSVLRTWGSRVLVLIGYKRYSDDDPLDHPGRRALYEQICASPGSYLAELSEETGVETETARYHLRILAFENLVSHESIRGRRRYFPVDTEWPALDAALHDESTASILTSLERNGPDTVSGLADGLDRDPSTVTHHLDRLADDGIVERERDGRAVMNSLTDPARNALDRQTAASESVRVATPTD